MYTRNEQFMLEAINQAKKAYENGESPVGAIIVKDGR
jgi:tRNA(adenine34) deaminase